MSCMEYYFINVSQIDSLPNTCRLLWLVLFGRSNPVAVVGGGVRINKSGDG